MWRYAIIRKTVRLGVGNKTQKIYDVHEIFYDKRGKINGWTNEPVTATGEGR